MRRSLIPIALVVSGFIVIPPLIHKLFPPELPAAILSLHERPRQLSLIRFNDGAGRSITLNHFHGRFILLNVWATWCTPCTEEMASLNRLASLFDEKDLMIVPISVDPSGAPTVRAFYSKLDLDRLNIYVDPSKKVMHALTVIGIPTTLLIDRDGFEIGRSIGAARWDAPTSVTRISDIVGR